MRRLYQKIYITIIASLFLVVMVAGGVWRFGPTGSPMAPALEMAGELAGAALPAADAPFAVQQEAIATLARRLRADLALFDPYGMPIAHVGRPLPPPSGRGEGGWVYGPGGPAWSFRLPDARWIVARAPPRHRNPITVLLMVLGGIALAVAVGAYPVVRGLTQRLERLQTGVETLGAGNLSARVSVEGHDEVARLAASFNRAAARIEDLVGAHRLLLANASHELRTPLARLRLGLELFESRPDPKYQAEMKRDIAELDQLIDEILLASRLDVTRTPQTSEPVDMLAVLAEECAQYDDVTLQGDPVTIKGDPRLLRRMVRNLLENAKRHGRPPVRVELHPDGRDVVLSVVDAGAGIPPAEREHVFTPFYRLAGDTAGTGLGLSLVRQIARLHGGDAMVAPRPDTPSCFVVRLPII